MNRFRNHSLADYLKVIGFLFICYFLIAEIVYAFRHPEMTGTQRFLNIIEVLLWQ